MEQIIQHLRTVEIEVAKGSSVEEAVRKIDVPIQHGLDYNSILDQFSFDSHWSEQLPDFPLNIRGDIWVL